MLMTDNPVERDKSALMSQGEMLTTGEIAEAAGPGFTRRHIDRLIREEMIPYFRMGSGWYQVPAWVAHALRRRAAEQVQLRQSLGRITGTDAAAEAERDRIREQLQVLEGPITEPPGPSDTPT